MYEIFHHCIEDTVKTLPFLFLTYLLMELIEHYTSDKTRIMIRKAGRTGPVFGGLLGLIPQCGLPAAAAGLYSGGVITAGTLIAVFLSSSDEMLPIMLSKQIPIPWIVRILTMKAGIAIIAGCIINLLFRRMNLREIGASIHKLCLDEECKCEESILKSAFRHALSVAVFIFSAVFFLELGISLIGKEKLGMIILNKPVIGSMIAGAIGLIPNCAASVVLTTLYVEGVLGLGSMMSGLLVGSGIGILVLFRTNKSFKENLKITGLLYVSGVLGGIIIEVLERLNLPV